MEANPLRFLTEQNVVPPKVSSSGAGAPNDASAADFRGHPLPALPAVAAEVPFVSGASPPRPACQRELAPRALPTAPGPRLFTTFYSE